MKTKKTLTRILNNKSIMALAISGAISLASAGDADAQLLKTFYSLSKPERHWVLKHPIAAYRTRDLADTAKRRAVALIGDPRLDGDINGGMVDAFKHTFWMAITSQKIGKKKAYSLGVAHEGAAYAEFIKDPNRAMVEQDKMSSDMDLQNNKKGVALGKQYPRISYQQMADTIMKMVTDGQCFKIKKRDSKSCLSESDSIINIHDYDGQWYIPKVLVPSNYQYTEPKTDNKKTRK